MRRNDRDRQRNIWNLAFAAAAALLVAGWTAPRAHASQFELNIQNASGRPIVLVYVSPATVRSWGDDVLGRPDLPNGESARINLSDRSPMAPCQWDVKFVYRGGTSAVSRANVCSGEPVIAPR
jgi:hypothetical protein